MEVGTYLKTNNMKETRSQIKAQITNELSKKFKERYENQVEYFKGEASKLRRRNEELLKQNQKLHDENAALKDKVDQLENWNERIMEFMEMPDSKEKFREFVENEKQKRQLNDYMLGLSHVTSMLFGLR